MFKNRVPREIIELRDEITGEWRKLHNAKLRALYSSLNIIRYLKSRRLRDEITGEWRKVHNAEVMHCILRLT